MSCENKLTNLVFNNKENCKNNNVLPFSFLSFLIYIYIYILNNKKTPRMKYMNVMQYKSQRQKRKTQKPKNNGHKRKAMKHKDHVRKTQLV